MVGPERRLFCRLDSSTPTAKEQQRLQAIADLGILAVKTVPVFDEATQTAARFLSAPICILGVMASDWLLFKSAVGLSRVGLMNELATLRQIARPESFCNYVVDSQQVLAIPDVATDPIFAKSSLFQHYGIRAYLGVPLLTSSGHCLGTLAVMDLMPRTFDRKDIEFLTLMAHWITSEFERQHLAEEMQNIAAIANLALSQPSESLSTAPITQKIKVKLLTLLSQELLTPLTSVMGMTSVLSREIYGPLTSKQKEYLDIIHRSGQYLVSLVDEIVALDVLQEHSQQLHLTSVDVEMLCQQVVNSLEQVADRRGQKLKLSVVSEHRVWPLDKDKVRHILYYLTLNLIQSTDDGSVIKIEVSSQAGRLNIAIGASDRYLEGDRSQQQLYSQSAVSSLNPISADACLTINKPSSISVLENQSPLSAAVAHLLTNFENMAEVFESSSNTRESLGLILSYALAEIHSGQISVSNSPQAGYGYQISFL
jgi:signal transduction histidine kinase